MPEDIQRGSSLTSLTRARIMHPYIHHAPQTKYVDDDKLLRNIPVIKCRPGCPGTWLSQRTARKRSPKMSLESRDGDIM